jgi:hypothetical protein
VARRVSVSRGLYFASTTDDGPVAFLDLAVLVALGPVARAGAFDRYSLRSFLVGHGLAFSAL